MVGPLLALNRVMADIDPTVVRSLRCYNVLSSTENFETSELVRSFARWLEVRAVSSSHLSPQEFSVAAYCLLEA